MSRLLFPVRESLPRVMIPSSVVTTGGSATVDPDGLVTFTGVSSVSLRDVFDGLGGDTYEILANLRNPTTVGKIFTRMRTASADVTAGYNRIGVNTVYAAGPTRSTEFGASVAAYWNPQSTNAPGEVNGSLKVYNPAKSTSVTQMRLQSIIAASDRYMWDEYDEVSGVHTGFTIIGVAGMSGWVKTTKLA